MQPLMMKPFLTFCVVVLCLGMSLPMAENSFGESSLRTYESGGLSFQYPPTLRPLQSSSAEKIRNMINSQMKSMGNTQSSVIALAVLLDQPTFRVLISKERFVAEPTPHYLIKEKKYLFAEAQKRGGINSYGAIQEAQITGHPTIEFKDIDKGPQGYGSNLTILCGRDTWNFSFFGNDRGNYENHYDVVKQIMSTIEVSGICERSSNVLS